MIQKVKEVYCFKNIIKTPDGTKLDATYDAVASHTDSITGELYINSGSGTGFSRSKNEVPFKDLSIYNTSPHHKVRKIKFWGSYGKSGNEPRKMMCPAEMEEGHLQAILETQKGIVGILDHIFLNELKFRKEQQLKDLREVCEDKNDNVKTKKMKL